MKYLAAVFLVAMVCLICPVQAVESERSLDMITGLGLGYYYLYPKDLQLQDFYKGAVTWQGFVEFLSDNGFSARGDINIYGENNRSSLAPAGTQLVIVPITASVAYHFMKDSSFSPFVGGGIGIYNISESDPDYTYLRAAKFGKHIFIGADLYFSRDTMLRAEVRQSFIDPASSANYYQANFSGLSATASFAFDFPIFGPKIAMSSEEAALDLERKKYEAQIRAHQQLLDEMEAYYRQKEWDARLYHRWPDRNALLKEIDKTQAEIDADKAKAEQIKAEKEQKRQEYLKQKELLRQQKKDSIKK